MRRINAFTNRHPFIGPIMWVLALQYFVVQLVVAAVWPKPYDWKLNVISDLGAVEVCGDFTGRFVCSPLAWLMNLSFIVFGFTIAVGALLLYTQFKRTRLSKTGFALMVISGISTIFVGLLPEDIAPVGHFIAAIPALLLGNVAIVLLAVSLDKIRSVFRLYTMLTGIVCVTAFVLFICGIYFGLGIGGMERVVSYPFAVWMMLFGMYMTFVRLRARKV